MNQETELQQCKEIAGREDKSPEEVRRLFNLGVRLAGFNSRDLLLSMEYAADRLYSDGAITSDKKVTLVAFLQELRQ